MINKHIKYLLLLIPLGITKLPILLADEPLKYTEVPTISLSKHSDSPNKQDRHPLIDDLKRLFDPLDKEAVAQQIHYPILIKYPLEIRNEAELLEHWDLIFDDKLVSRITDSSISDWSRVGWRGVMLDNGAVWVNEGSGKIRTTVYTTDKAQRLFEAFTENLKKKLHPSVAEYGTNKMDLISTRYRLRMDWLDDDVLRLALWESGKDISNEPKVVLMSDDWRYEGSAGYFYATFRKDGLRYEYTPYGKHLPMLSIYQGDELCYQEEFENFAHKIPQLKQD